MTVRRQYGIMAWMAVMAVKTRRAAIIAMNRTKKNEGRNYSHSRGPRIVVFKPTLYYETTNYLNI